MTTWIIVGIGVLGFLWVAWLAWDKKSKEKALGRKLTWREHGELLEQELEEEQEETIQPSEKERKQCHFHQAFNLFAEQANIPESVRQDLCKEMQQHINDSRKAAKVVEQHVGDGWVWEDGLKAVQICNNKRGTFKQQAAMFAGCVIGRYYTMTAFERAKRSNRDWFPYLLLTKGPVACACPEHEDDIGRFIEVDSDYWEHRPLRKTPFCRCMVRTVSNYEYERSQST